jgi:hypothetical protein
MEFPPPLVFQEGLPFPLTPTKKGYKQYIRCIQKDQQGLSLNPPCRYFTLLTVISMITQTFFSSVSALHAMCIFLEDVLLHRISISQSSYAVCIIISCFMNPEGQKTKTGNTAQERGEEETGRESH